MLWGECLCPAPPNSYVNSFTYNAIVFGKQLGLDEIMREGPRDGISVLIRGTETRALSTT